MRSFIEGVHNEVAGACCSFCRLNPKELHVQFRVA